MRVIDHDGGMLGVMQTADALSRARKVGLDLVEVNPKKSPPVCKILDYGRFKYEQLRDARRQRNASDRNLRLGPHADRQDVDRKLRLAREYLGAGRRVSLSVQPRGGEVLDPSRAESLLDEFAKLCADIARVVRPVPIEERTVTVTLVPLRLSSRESHEPK